MGRNMMKVGLIGIGRMGKALVSRLKGHVEITIYSRDKEYTAKIASELGVNFAGKIEKIADNEAIILAVPDQEIPACIREFNQLGYHSHLISIATNVTQQILDEAADGQVTCIGVKFIGQADEISAGDPPVIVINSYPRELVPVAKKIFVPVGDVIVGQADMVAKINYITAQKVIEAAVKIEKELREQGYMQDSLIHTAIRQVGVGVLKAYSYHNLGPFGRKIEQEVRAQLKNS